MTNPSNKIEKMKQDPELEEIIRSQFRIPVAQTGKVWVVIDQKRYQVCDMGTDGVRILMDNTSEFLIEQILAECELIIFKTSIKNIIGQVVHISTGDDDNRWQCGIQWHNMPEKGKEQINEIVLKMKTQLLKDDVITFDDAQG